MESLDFMEISTVKIRRVGGEDDPLSEIVVEVQAPDGEWREIGRERVFSNFSHNWSMPACWRDGKQSNA